MYIAESAEIEPASNGFSDITQLNHSEEIKIVMENASESIRSLLFENKSTISSKSAYKIEKSIKKEKTKHASNLKVLKKKFQVGKKTDLAAIYVQLFQKPNSQVESQSTIDVERGIYYSPRNYHQDEDGKHPFDGLYVDRISFGSMNIERDSIFTYSRPENIRLSSFVVNNRITHIGTAIEIKNILCTGLYESIDEDGYLIRAGIDGCIYKRAMGDDNYSLDDRPYNEMVQKETILYIIPHNEVWFDFSVSLDGVVSISSR